MMSQHAIPEKVLLTAEDVAEQLQVHPNTVYQLVRDGKLRTVRLGPRLTRFRQADVDAFIDAKASDDPVDRREPENRLEMDWGGAPSRRSARSRRWGQTSDPADRWHVE